MIVLAVIFLVSLLTIGIGAVLLAPWLPTRSRDLKRACELADFKDGEVFYDLGCGDGRLLFFAEKSHRVKCIGFEIALPFYLYAKIKQLFTRSKTVIKFGDFFNSNLEDAGVVYVFGTRGTLAKRVKEKFEKELKPGTRVLSYSFPIENWNPVVVSRPTEKDLPIYLYKIN